ncbi:hypothetical protein HDU98_002965 [Podochytrium sp. JEL0797]|nr:hypothetical protein HDU98_002965 [Podochytrium sp. JEL0797]
MKFLTLASILIAAVSAHEGHDHAAPVATTAPVAATAPVVATTAVTANVPVVATAPIATTGSVAATGQAKPAAASIYQSGAKEIAAFGAVAAVSVLLF